MKYFSYASAILVACSLVLTGCSKSEKLPSSGGSVDVIDATRLRPAFESANAQASEIVDSVMTAIQGSNPSEALAGLDKLAAQPDLSDAQKKVVTDLAEQLKKKIATQQQ